MVGPPGKMDSEGGDVPPPFQSTDTSAQPKFHRASQPPSTFMMVPFM